MKHYFFLFAILLALPGFGQENSLERAVSLPCYAEVTTDTVPAIELSFGAWEQKGLIELSFEALGQEGFTVNPPEVRDTIGERVEEVIRIFFYTEDGGKKYLDLVQRNYVSGTKDRDRRFEAYNY